MAKKHKVKRTSNVEAIFEEMDRQEQAKKAPTTEMVKRGESLSVAGYQAIGWATKEQGKEILAHVRPVLSDFASVLTLGAGDLRASSGRCSETESRIINGFVKEFCSNWPTMINTNSVPDHSPDLGYRLTSELHVNVQVSRVGQCVHMYFIRV